MSAAKRRIKRKPDPFPASRWMPLAEKYGMTISWQTKCINTSTEGKFIIEFWGSKALPTIGACVVAIARKIP